MRGVQDVLNRIQRCGCAALDRDWHAAQGIAFYLSTWSADSRSQASWDMAEAEPRQMRKPEMCKTCCRYQGFGSIHNKKGNRCQ